MCYYSFFAIIVEIVVKFLQEYNVSLRMVQKLNLSYGFELRNSDTRNFIAVIQNQAAPVNLWLKSNQQLKFRYERCR